MRRNRLALLLLGILAIPRGWNTAVSAQEPLQVAVTLSAPLLWTRESDNLTSQEGVRRAAVAEGWLTGIRGELGVGSISATVGWLGSIGDRTTTEYLPPVASASARSTWSAQYGTLGLGLAGSIDLAPDWNVFGGVELAYWMNLSFSDEATGRSRESLSDADRAALDELFVVVGGGAERRLAGHWSLVMSAGFGYNLLGSEDVWQALADNSPELFYWHADIFLAIHAGLRYRL